MSWEHNPYYHPENLGLTTVATLEFSDLDYQFDTRVVWRHDATGKLYTARDAGCSCPTPFEDYTTVESLDSVDYAELAREVREGYSSNPNFFSEATDFLGRVRRAVQSG